MNKLSKIRTNYEEAATPVLIYSQNYDVLYQNNKCKEYLKPGDIKAIESLIKQDDFTRELENNKVAGISYFSKNVNIIFEIIFHLLDDLLLGIVAAKDELYSPDPDSQSHIEKYGNEYGITGVLYCDEEFGILSRNDAAIKILCGETPDRNAYLQNFTQLEIHYLNGTEFSIEDLIDRKKDEIVTIRAKSGRLINVSINLFSPNLPESQQKIYIITLHDITKQKIVERKIMESENKYRTLFENLPTGFAFHRMLFNNKNNPIDYIFLEANPTFEKLTGLKREEIIHRTVTQVIPGIDKSWIEKYGRVAMYGETAEFENYLPENDKYYKVLAYSPRKNYFATIFSDITERKKIEENLRVSEVKFRGVFENSIDPIALVRNSKHIMVNDAYVTTFGYSTQKEVLELSTIQMIADSQKERVKSYIQARNNKLPAPFKYETLGVKKNGVEFDISIHVSTYSSEDTLNTIVVIRDITKSKRYEKAILESERRFRALSDATYEGILILKAGKILEYNKAFMSLFKFDEIDMNNMNIELLKFNIPVQEIFKNCFKKSKERLEVIALRKTGEHFWIEIECRPIDYKGESVFVFAMRDITGWKETQKKLQKNYLQQQLLSEISYLHNTNINFDDVMNNSLKTIGESLGVGRVYIFEHSEDGEFTSNTYEWVDAGTDSKIDLLKKIPRSLLPEWDVLISTNGYIAANNIDELPNEIRDFLRQQGISSILVFPLVVREMNYGFIGLDNSASDAGWEDIDIELLRTISNIISNSYEKKLSHQEIILAKKNAESSDRLKSEFLAQVSHEIRTPINLLLNSNSLLKEYITEPDEDINEIYNIAGSAGKRIIRTIDHILNMSEVQLGTYEIIKKEIDLSKMLSELVTEFKFVAEKKGISISLQVAEGAHIYNGDEYSVTQIYANLIDNAVKYTQKGNITVKLSENTSHYIVEIIDTGIGISKEFQNTLFEPFSQEEQGYTRRFEGTGLGLALVKNYCDINEIEIEVESEKGKGTCFRTIMKK